MELDSGRCAGGFGVLASSRQTPPLEPSPSAEIVGDVGHDDDGLGALEADAADGELHPGFYYAKTCSALARTADFRALVLAVRFGIGLPTGFRRWLRLVLPRLARNAWFAFER